MRSNDEIIEIIKSLKDEKGLSLSELARRVHLAKSGLSLIFNKTRPFPTGRVEIFARVLGTTPQHILGFENQETAPVWGAELTDEDELEIEEQLERMLAGTSSYGHFAAYGGKRPSDMDEDEYENHILFKNSLKETLRLAKLINKEKNDPEKYRKVSD